MDVFLLQATLPEVTVLFPTVIQGWLAAASIVDTFHPMCLLSSLAIFCALTLCGRTSGATLLASRLWEYFPAVKTASLHEAI